MINNVNCVIDTHNKTERQELIDYISERSLAVAIINDDDGFQLIVVHAGVIGNIGVDAAKDLVNNQGYKHFFSVKEYKEYIDYEKHKHLYTWAEWLEMKGIKQAKTPYYETIVKQPANAINKGSSSNMNKTKKVNTRDGLEEICKKHGLKYKRVNKTGCGVITSNKPIMITAALSNGMVVRVPLENSQETIKKLEEKLKSDDN